MSNAREAHDTTRPDDGNRLGDDLPRTSTFHDDVRLKPHFCDTTGMVGRAKSAHEFGFRPGCRSVQDVNFQPELFPNERAKQTNWARTRHEHGPRLPKGTLAHRKDMLPGLGDNRRGLQQHTENP